MVVWIRLFPILCSLLFYSSHSFTTTTTTNSPPITTTPADFIEGNIPWNAGDADRAFRRGIQLEKNGQARKATSAFHEAATLYQCCLDQPDAFGHVTALPDPASRRALLAYTCLSLGYLHLDAQRDAPLAAARLFQLASTNQPTAVSWDGRGQALEAAAATTSSLGQALEAYRAALSYDANYTPARFHVAVVLDRMLAHTKNSTTTTAGVLFDAAAAREEKKQILEDLRRQEASVCLVDSWGYCRWHMRKQPDANFYLGTRDMIELALRNAMLDTDNDADAIVCEFGVGSGRTLRMTQDVLELGQEMHGFDTFTGLPQAWGVEPAGSYSTGGVVPNIGGNVVFHKGLFRDTIPPFLKQVKPTAFLSYAHIDCRLYTSTIDILEGMHSRVVPGTIIMFSEYICHPTWRQDEFRAWRECCKRFGWKYEYLAFSLNTKNVVVRVTHA